MNLQIPTYVYIIIFTYVHTYALRCPLFPMLTGFVQTPSKSSSLALKIRIQRKQALHF